MRTRSTFCNCGRLNQFASVLDSTTTDVRTRKLQGVSQRRHCRRRPAKSAARRDTSQQAGGRGTAPAGPARALRPQPCRLPFRTGHGRAGDARSCPRQPAHRAVSRYRPATRDVRPHGDDVQNEGSRDCQQALPPATRSRYSRTALRNVAPPARLTHSKVCNRAKIRGAGQAHGAFEQQLQRDERHQHIGCNKQDGGKRTTTVAQLHPQLHRPDPIPTGPSLAAQSRASSGVSAAPIGSGARGRRHKSRINCPLLARTRRNRPRPPSSETSWSS